MRKDDLLILHYDAFEASVVHLFNDLNNSEELQQYFINNPIATLYQRIDMPMQALVQSGRVALTERVENRANKLFFALVSNDAFRAWLTDYQRVFDDAVKHEIASGKTPDDAIRAVARGYERAKVLNDVSAAIAKYIDTDTATALVGALSAGDDVTGELPQELPILFFLVAVVAVAVAAVGVYLMGYRIEAQPGQLVTRQDIARISALLASGLEAHARQLRAAGTLGTIDRS